jgi:hypothetical protein
MNAAADKIKMMKASIRCLIYGLLGLLPVIGLPFALAALWISGRVRQQEKQFWNAAKPYRGIGVVCAALGTICWFLVVVFIIYQSVFNGGGYGGTYGLADE